MRPDRTATATVISAYLIATGVALVLAYVDPMDGPITRLALADVAATLVVFGFSAVYRNSSFYDAYWSVAPPLLWLGWLILAGAFDVRAALTGVVVMAWAVRLTRNWWIGWEGLAHADWRYERLSSQLGVLYWPVSLLGVHMLPTAIVFAGCLPLYLISISSRPLNALDAVAVVIGGASLWIETRADRELREFREVRSDRGQTLTTGVWSWCRHPNYLGEIGFWVSLACFGAAAAPGVWWAFAGVAAMLALFLATSIPMIERKLSDDKPGYAEYRKRTPMLLPYGALRRANPDA